MIRASPCELFEVCVYMCPTLEGKTPHQQTLSTTWTTSYAVYHVTITPQQRTPDGQMVHQQQSKSDG